jgi:hypothetical protein
MLLTLLQKHWKSLAVLLMLFLAYAGGLYQGRSHGVASITTETKTTETSKVVAQEDDKKSVATDDKKKVDSDTQKHVKTVIVQKADGTKTTTIVEDDNKKTDVTDDDKTKSTEDDKKQTVTTDTKTSDTKTTTTFASNESHYKLGLFFDKPLQNALSELPTSNMTYGVSASTRVLGPAWVDATYNFGKKDVTLGISIEF